MLSRIRSIMLVTLAVGLMGAVAASAGWSLPG